MACPARDPLCPICRGPLYPDDITGSPAGEYPTHAHCRAWMQESAERMDDDEQEREYRGREEDREDEDAT